MSGEKREDLVFGENYFPDYVEVRSVVSKSGNNRGSVYSCAGGKDSQSAIECEIAKEILHCITTEGCCYDIDMGEHEYEARTTLHPFAKENFPVRVTILRKRSQDNLKITG